MTLLEDIASFSDAAAFRPETVEPLMQMAALIWDHPATSPELLELCRRRIATLLGGSVDFGFAGGPSIEPTKAAALDRYDSDPAFSELERLAIGYAEQFVLDPHGLDDDDAASLVRAFGERGFVRFSYALAMFESLQRFGFALGLPAHSGAVLRGA